MRKLFIWGILIVLMLTGASCGGPGTAAFTVSEAPKTVVAGGDYCFAVQNKLEKEVAGKLELKVEGKTEASQRVELGPQEKRELCFKDQFMEPGEYNVQIADLSVKVEALSREEALPISIAEVSPKSEQVVTGGVITYRLTVKNNTDTRAQREIELRLDDRVIDSQKAVLPPGESQALTFEVSQTDQPGEHLVRIGDQRREIEVVSRTGELPSNPKVLGAAQGLTELGRPGGKIVVGALEGPKTLNHHIAQETSTTNVTAMLHAGLVEANPLTAEIEPALATDWELSPDKREIIFYLREGVKWSDGEPFNADDVVFTFDDVILNEDVNTDARDVLQVKGEPIEVEKLDDYTVKVTTPEPFRPIFRIIGLPIMPEHKLAQHVAKLNPGAMGSMRAAKNELESRRESLQAVAPEKLAQVEQDFGNLARAIEAQDPAQVAAVISVLKANLEELSSALPQELQETISNVEDQLHESVAYAQEGKFAGVPPGNFNDAWSLGTAPEEIVGLGPFRFKEYATDQQVVLERNPYFWKTDRSGTQLPYIDQLVFLVVGTLDVAFLKFQTGETDAYGPRPEDWPLLMESAEEKGWDLVRDGPTFGTAFVTFNQDVADEALRAVFRSLGFRRAIAHAIDKEAIIENIYNGLAIPQWSPVSVPSPYYDREESFAKYEFDLERAGNLLDEAGLVDTDGDGIRNITDRFLSEAGLSLGGLPAEEERELGFMLTTNRGNTIREDLGNLFTSDWLKIGIKVNFKPVDFNSLVTDLLGSKYEAVIIGFTGGVEPNNGANVWKTDGGLHFWRYSAKEKPPEWEKRVDELLDLGATTFDEDQVKEYYSEYQRLVSEHLPVIYTVNQQFLYASQGKLGNNEGFNPNGGVLSFAEMLWWKEGR